MSIDIGSAAFSGFGLIGRRPLSVLVWGLAYLVLLGLPSLYFMSQIMPAYAQMMHGMIAAQAANPGATPAEAQAQMQAQMMQWMPAMQKAGGLGWLMFFLSIAVRGILTAAVLRAVLEPDNKGFFYLRLGAQELWQMLLTLAVFVLSFIFIFVIAIVGGILAALMGALGSAAALGRLLVLLLCMIVTIYIVLRLSMAPAMTFRDKTFRLFESWKLTSGHVAALFAIVLILIAVLIVVEIVVGGGIVAWVMANRDSLKASLQPYAGANGDVEGAFKTIMTTMRPIIIGAVAVGSLLSGAFLAIFLAPFATVYKQLTAGAAAPTT